MTQNPAAREEKRRLYPACTNCVHFGGVLISIPKDNDAFHEERITGYLCKHPKNIKSSLESAARVDILAKCPRREIDARLVDSSQLLEENEHLKKREEELMNIIGEYREKLFEDQGATDVKKEVPAAKKELKDVEFSDIL